MKNELKICVMVALVTAALATLGPSNTKKGKQKAPAEVKTNQGPVDKSVFDRGLVDAEPLASSIISEANTYFRDTSLKNFNGTVLGYVTPVKIK
jgi:chitinase domain-containing protein 1